MASLCLVASHSRVGNSLIGFLSKSLVFCKKLAIEQFAQKSNNLFIHSFLVSNLSKTLMVVHFWWATWAICSHCSFLVSDLGESLTVAHLSWGHWEICSRHSFVTCKLSNLLTVAHFVLSILSESLTVAHLIWANERLANEQWANEQIPNRELLPMYLNGYPKSGAQLTPVS